jgi:hypothetical protein
MSTEQKIVRTQAEYDCKECYLKDACFTPCNLPRGYHYEKIQ